MNKTIKNIAFSLLLLGLQFIYAQAPQKMSFQAVIRNASNQLITTSNVAVKVSILQGSSNGTVVYSETQNATTNINGLASLVIGNGTVVSGAFSTINWSSGTYFIRSEIDPIGGTNYTIANTTQMLSVPYALQAQTAANYSETDPQVSMNASGKIAKWNGSSLVDSVLEDNGSNIGIAAIPTVDARVTVNGRLSANDIRMTDGATNGYVMGSDAQGNGSWVNPNLFSKVGSSTLNAIPKWNGNALVDGTIQDNGSNIGIATTPAADSRVNINGRLTANDIRMTDGATNGYILRSDANGNATWVNPSSIITPETDPQVASSVNQKVPRWNGTALVDGIIQDNGTGIGINTIPVSGNELTINGKTATTNFQMTNGATNGYVLKSNAAGNATWTNPNSLITETDPQIASTTSNYIPKWNGTALVDGQIFDNGTKVGIGTTAPNSDLTIGAPFSFSGIQRKLSVNTTNNQPIVVGETINNKAIMFGYDGNNIQGRSGADYSQNGDLILNNYGGNVGIGTTTPSDKFEVVGKTKTTSLQTTNFQMTNGAASGYVLQSNATGIASWANPTALGINETDPKVASTTVNKLSKWDGTNLIDSQIIDNGTSIGIGTLTPTQAKFVVSGNENSIVANYGFLKADGSTGTNNSGTGQNYSIYASNRIAASEFNAFSDARIKNIKGITNSKNDLETLSKIEITNYTLKDSISKGNNNYKKVIAQQVEKVYPQAVSKLTDVVPDIYKQAEIKNGFIGLENNLKAGEKVKLITQKGEEIAEVKDANSKGFKIENSTNGFVFVYGRQVSDFRSVDYEALSTLNISATQELLKRIEVIEKENFQLKTEVSKIEKIEAKLNQLANENSKLKADNQSIQQLEKDIETLKSQYTKNENSTLSKNE